MTPDHHGGFDYTVIGLIVSSVILMVLAVTGAVHFVDLVLK